MSNGVGRGRGWLNLKAQNTINPGAENNTSPVTIISATNFKPQDNKNFANASNDYTDLISKIRQLNINDDGIKFNQKIRYIVESWNQDCQSSLDVENSFESIHEACLADADLATKLVLLIASRTFLSQEIREQNIRLMFLRKLQDNFEGCTQLQSTDPIQFRNSVQLMGEFFSKARLANGQQFLFMATPLLSYLEMLLDSTESLDLKLFTMQLHLNGNLLKQECPEKIADVLNKVRHTLCSNKEYAKESKLWLLLALEVANNRFALLPGDIHKFYQEQLGDGAMASFQGSHGTLTVQTIHNSKSLDSYQSSVNVLQVSTDSGVDIGLSLNSVSDVSANCSNSVFQNDANQIIQNSGSRRDSNTTSNKGGKSGRPILGAGARLQKNRVQTNESTDDWNTDKSNSDPVSSNYIKTKTPKDDNKESNWRERENKRGTDLGNQKKDWGERKKTSPKNKKGWEHDDRFETDYN